MQMKTKKETLAIQIIESVNKHFFSKNLSISEQIDSNPRSVAQI